MNLSLNQEYFKLLNKYTEGLNRETALFYSKKYTPDPATSPKGSSQVPESIFNGFTLFQYRGVSLDYGSDPSTFYKDSRATQPEEIELRLANDVTPEPTITNLVNMWENPTYRGALYDYPDFIFCKYYRKIPNNYLLTLRRYAKPTGDNIYSGKVRYEKDPRTTSSEKIKTRYKNKKGEIVDGNRNITVNTSTDETSLVSPDIARAVTWFGEGTGNDLSRILEFSYGYNFDTVTGEDNPIRIGDETSASYQRTNAYQNAGIFSKMAADFMLATDVKSKYKALFTADSGDNTRDFLSETYPNFVIGPINVINKMQLQKRGLNFTQNIVLKFEYEIRSYNGINPKVAMLDLLANLLVLTYNNANFFGGANRLYGASSYVGKPLSFSDLKSGNIKGFFRNTYSLIDNSVTDIIKSITGTKDGSVVNDGGVTGGQTAIGALEKVFNNIGGFLSGAASYALNDFLGGFLREFAGPGPATLVLPALLTGENTGNWHLTVGNPFNPIAMIGNLILVESKLNFGDTLGDDDFPTSLVLEVTLNHARPRDKTDFESMFNGGRGRLYTSRADTNDVLNLRGVNQQTYGSIAYNNNSRLAGGSKNLTNGYTVYQNNAIGYIGEPDKIYTREQLAENLNSANRRFVNESRSYLKKISQLLSSDGQSKNNDPTALNQLIGMAEG